MDSTPKANNRIGSQCRVDFPAEEFAARRERLFEAIGSQAHALLLSALAPGGYVVFRQTNEFFYCCGLETPQSYLLMNGAERKAMLYLPERGKAQLGEGAPPGVEDADLVKAITGVDEVYSREKLSEHLADVKVVYTPHAPGELRGAIRHGLLWADQMAAQDPWDGQPSREQRLVSLLRSRFPQIEVRDLTPILDELRSVKSPREITVMRRAGQLGAQAIREAMRVTRPGILEYQLGALANYIYLLNGARGEGYHPIVASGENIWHIHYSLNNCPLEGGDLVLMDVAPECSYYTSDMGRMWPVNGTYAPWQRELYGYIVEYHKVVLSRIRPSVMPDQVMGEAAEEMKIECRLHFARGFGRGRRAEALEGSMAESRGSQTRFVLRWNYGGITSLKLLDDVFDTDYIWPDETLGEVVVRYRLDEGDWREATAFSSGDVRQVHISREDAPEALTFSYEGDSVGAHGIRDFRLAVQFARRGDSLVWTLRFRNSTDRLLELGDIALPLPFNRQFVEDNLANYTRVVARHSFISGHGSFIFWERPNGVGPYLVMTPLEGTKLEYYEEHEPDRSRSARAPYWAYIHSAVSGAGETRGTWRQLHTSVTLAPKGTPGDEINYGFKFRWADDYDGVRDVLYEESLFDVHVVPGMAVPEDLFAMFALRTKNASHTISPEYPDQTQIEYLGEKETDTHVYKVKFSRLGENLLTVNYGDDRYTVLEFFVTEPLETLIKKRAAFLVSKQQHRDPSKWYNGLFSVWDMRNKVLRGPDDTDGFDGWWGYVLACDDTALPKAPFIAAKNVHYPVQEEIAAIEYYIENFVWGKLQRTDQEEPYPYFIYGVPNWFENRYSEHGFGSGGKGLEHVWRSYDYPHVTMLYFHLYQIAKMYPGITKYLDKDGYLERAFGTAKAHFTLAGIDDLPAGARGYWAYTLGLYNELLIIDLIEALHEEGRDAQADWLKSEWEKKVKYFVYDDPYPFDSEYPFDTTAFESSHAIAKYGLANPVAPDESLWYDKYKDKWYSHPQVKREDFEQFMEKQIQANIALRGWVEPAYYLLGSDYRGGISSRYALSYMSQAGGWAIADYALYHTSDPTPYLRLGYASYLSSWALMNTGTPESNYGYWYPGEENDGGSGWALTPEKYGPTWIGKDNSRGAWFYDGEIEIGYSAALRTAATIVTEDPLFGLFAYGGLLREADDRIEVIPRDGLRKRFHVIRGGRRLHMLLDRDGFAAEQPIVVDDELREIRFTLENQTRAQHVAILCLAGLPASDYSVHIDGELADQISSRGDEWITVDLPVSLENVHDVEIRST